MKAFLFVFDQSRITREEVVRHIDAIEEIYNWYAFFGNTMCLATDMDIKDLSNQIREACPDLKFILTAVDKQNRAGWLPKSVWTFLNHPHAAESESA